MPGGRTGSVIGAALPDHEQLRGLARTQGRLLDAHGHHPRLKRSRSASSSATPGVDELVLLADHAAAQPLALQREPRAGPQGQLAPASRTSMSSGSASSAIASRRFFIVRT